MKKLLLIAILLLSLVGSAGQAAAGGPGTASPSGTTWESLGITWE